MKTIASHQQAGHKAACNLSPCRPQLGPTTTLQHTRSVQVAAAPNSGSWYEQSSARSSSSGPSSSSSSSSSSSDGQQQKQQRQRSRHYYDTSPRHGRQSGDTRGGTSHSEHSSEVDQEDGNGPGWWEVPREVRNQRQQQQAAAAARSAADGLQLQPWQEEKLLLAAAGSKKKMQVQQLATDLGLDRSEVLAWVADFRSKPKQEQARLLAPLQQQIQQQQQQQNEQQETADPFWAATTNSSSSSSSSSSASAAAVPAALPFSAPNPNTGYVPFAARRDAAAAAGARKGRRLPAEVLRTLEGVYNRSPWPSREVVAGLFDLHRLPRDTVLDWFTARRDMDGVPHNPRQAKLLARSSSSSSTAAAAAQQALVPPPAAAAGTPQVQQQAGSAAAAAAGAAVSRLTARELAALRSALPSPNKLKGAKLAEELGIKAGRGPELEISGITFVARDGAAAWRCAWRRRRATKGLPAQRLDFQQWFL